MIYTVTFNPAIDYIVKVDNLTPGSVNRVSKEQILPGGKGVNVSIVLKNLGYDNTAIGFLSGFTGATIEAMLRNYGCNTDFIKLSKGMSRINVKIRGNVETEINGIGPDITNEDIARLYEKLDKLKAGDILVLAGSIPNTISDNIYMNIMKYLQNKDIKIVVDATKDLLLNVLKYKPFLVKPNNHELGEMFGVEIKSKEEVLIYAKKIKEMGARNVLVSMAGDGALLIDEKDVVHKSEAPEGKLVNSVGAGDSLVAGFIAGYLENYSYEQAFKMGVATGSASAFSQYLATKEEVMGLMKKLD